MFTVKHITNNGETIYEVDNTSLDKSAQSTSSGVQGIGTLYLNMRDGVTGSIDSGRAYVMNRYGSTVASYDFGDSFDLQNSPLATSVVRA